MASWPTQAPGTTADVALILEGTYPFITGGVSSWVQEIIRGLPELTFSLLFIGGAKESYGEPRFECPKNVVHLECHYLTTSEKKKRPRLHAGEPPAFELNNRLHECFRSRDGDLGALLKELAPIIGNPRGLSHETFLHSEAAWNAVCDDYEARCTDPSFLDYFWSVRTMHGPLFTLAEIADRIPPARLFHSISTGYAGFLGMLLRYRRQKPFIVTEHGIYTKERKIDLAHAAWIREDTGLFDGAGSDTGYLRQLWIRFYESIGRCAYAAAGSIIALHEGNRQRQITDGAKAERTRIIPNGIEVARFEPLRAKRPEKIPHVMGLLGRIVPIKDVRTFIRAMRTVCDRIPDAEGWIVGPTAEDEQYGRECVELVKSLGLEGRVKFLGFQKPDEILPKLGLMVLTSISEALPLVILEAYASGLPCIATDVGACRELIDGYTPEDRKLGSAGAVTPIASPDHTAEAAIELFTDEARWYAAQAAGIARVERFYARDMMLDAYRNVYREGMSWRE